LQELLSQLIALQDLDSKTDQLESLRGDLPLQVNRLKQEFEEAEKNKTDYTKKHLAYQKERGIAEMEIKALEGKQKKYQAQLYQVKSNREYDAVTMEIEAVKIETEKKESRILELMDLEDETAKAIAANEEEMGKIRTQLDKVSKELEKKMAKTEKDEAALKHERDKILHKLNARYASAYERIRRAKNGLAVVPVLRGACGGCFKSLPPQRILEIRQMDRMFLCEVCGRILIWDEDKAEAPE
jgi:predicted  nucleic acid-binding Zn-ribbon protein